MRLIRTLWTLVREAKPAMIGALSLSTYAASAQELDLVWVQQTGSPGNEIFPLIASDASGATYVTGGTNGSLGGPNLGLRDVPLLKHDAGGSLIWSRQFGTPQSDWGLDVAVDAAGDAYVVGTTLGDLAGPNQGFDDAFVVKFDASGNQVWAIQFGTDIFDTVGGAAVDSAGDLYVTGGTFGDLFGTNAGSNDIWLAKFDSTGSLIWGVQFGTPELDFTGVLALDAAGNPVIAGATRGAFSGTNQGDADVFVAKLDSTGTLLWTSQVGSSFTDQVAGVALDSFGAVYVGGQTNDDLGGPNAGLYDAFLMKLDSAGDHVWTRQIGTPEQDAGEGVAVDAAGTVFFVGRTGDIVAPPGVGGLDAFVLAYDGSGSLLAARQFGTPDGDAAYDVALDPAGGIFVTGTTGGSFGGPNAGEGDFFLAKLGESECYPDCTGNLSLDIFDFLCFQDAFVTADPYADCDGNSTFDINDFLCFQDSFVAGCP